MANGNTTKTLRPFIDLGWHTVPLSGELKRLSNGKKTIPDFPKDWKERFKKSFNETDSSIGGVLTGNCSNVIAIDCDDSTTFDIFNSLDPSYNFKFISKGKKSADGTEQRAGIIVYEYTDELPDSYGLNTPALRLDFYSNGGFIYLPTSDNQTKEPFELTELKPAPPAVISLIKSLKPVRIKVEERVLNEKAWKHNLHAQVAHFVGSKKIVPTLFRILTPKDFRDMDEYIDKGYIHPNDVPEGRGSEYLSKVSAILGADSSIDIELYVNAMELINDQFTYPMTRSRLSSTIIEPMVEERASIDGEPIWVYDENWEADKLQIPSKRNQILDIFFDPRRTNYYIADVLEGQVKSFGRDSDFYSYVNTVAIDALPKKEIQARLPLVDIVSSPSRPFGFFTGKENVAFNTFHPTVALSIFNEPEKYAHRYTRPQTIIRFLESLVPDNYMRNYLLRFLRRKFTTFDYSPVVLYFLGVPGAGKDTLVNIIQSLIGSDSIARPTVKEFLEMYNGWLLDKYFVQLDEYGNQLTRFDEKENALGKIKAYTGKKEVQIRMMRTDGFPHEHYATFIMTANKNPLFIEGDDRRMALFDCPNKLADELWVQQLGGLTVLHNQIENELNDFAFYLATEVDMLSADEYQTPPETEDKKKLIASKYGAAQRLAFLFENAMFEDIERLALEYDSHNLFNKAADGRIYEDDLFDLYYEMTDGKGTKRGLSVAMKSFTKIPTTQTGVKVYYYNIPNLAKHTATKPFGEIKDEE